MFWEVSFWSHLAFFAEFQFGVCWLWLFLLTLVLDPFENGASEGCSINFEVRRGRCVWYHSLQCDNLRFGLSLRGRKVSLNKDQYGGGCTILKLPFFSSILSLTVMQFILSWFLPSFPTVIIRSLSAGLFNPNNQRAEQGLPAIQLLGVVWVFCFVLGTSEHSCWHPPLWCLYNTIGCDQLVVLPFVEKHLYMITPVSISESIGILDAHHPHPEEWRTCLSLCRACPPQISSSRHPCR